MKHVLCAAALAALPLAPAFAEPVTYALDPSHSQIVFSYNHLGYSTTWGMFSGFNGEIAFDEADPGASTVAVSFPVTTMLTGWEARFEHFMSSDFFNAASQEMVSFTSTGIEVTGENTAIITGDLTMNGITQSVALDTVLNQSGPHPQSGAPTVGFSASTTVLRSDFGVGAFAPFVSDEVEIQISVEAAAAQ